MTDFLLMNNSLDVNKFKADVDVYCVRAEYNYIDSQADDVKMDKPATFENIKCFGWEESVYRYFNYIKNFQGIRYCT